MSFREHNISTISLVCMRLSNLEIQNIINRKCQESIYSYKMTNEIYRYKSSLHKGI